MKGIWPGISIPARIMFTRIDFPIRLRFGAAQPRTRLRVIRSAYAAKPKFPVSQAAKAIFSLCAKWRRFNTPYIMRGAIALPRMPELPS